jgi:ABC-2 type transport system ATP-binding protein
MVDLRAQRKAAVKRPDRSSTLGAVAAIEVEELCRTYRSRTGIFRRRRAEVHALNGISFEVAQGQLFGLLGPNGAGKTTTIKILTTLLLPTSGSARVLGIDPAADPGAIRRRIGHVFGGDRGLYDRLSALDNLRYFADLYRVPVRDKRRRIAELLDLVGLTGRERERVETYSRGMRQRLHIARGLLHDPEILFLDEPTIGLDPVGARELREMIGALRSQGKTILLTTHYMYEADELCQSLAVIADGRIVASGTPAELKSRVVDRTVIEIETFGVPETTVGRLRDVQGVLSVSTEIRDQAELVLVQSRTGAELVQSLLRELDGTTVGRVIVREPTLEDAYVELVGAA